MTLLTVPIRQIKPYKNNPRKNDGAVEAVMESIKQCDYEIPDDSVIVDWKYIVTKHGDIYRYSSNHKRIEPQKKRVHSNGYIRGVMFGKDVYIHRIVAECFLENPCGYKEINHKDGNKANNSVENLEWCTRQENCKHMFESGLRDYSDLTQIAKMPRLKSRKLTADQVRLIREQSKSGMTDKQIAEKMHTSRGQIYQIKTGQTYREIV